MGDARGQLAPLLSPCPGGSRQAECPAQPRWLCGPHAATSPFTALSAFDGSCATHRGTGWLPAWKIPVSRDAQHKNRLFEARLLRSLFGDAAFA